MNDFERTLTLYNNPVNTYALQGISLGKLRKGFGGKKLTGFREQAQVKA